MIDCFELLLNLLDAAAKAFPLAVAAQITRNNPKRMANKIVERILKIPASFSSLNVNHLRIINGIYSERRTMHTIFEINDMNLFLETISGASKRSDKLSCNRHQLTITKLVQFHDVRSYQ